MKVGQCLWWVSPSPVTVWLRVRREAADKYELADTLVGWLTVALEVGFSLVPEPDV